MAYGMELILDLHGCQPANFSRKNIEAFFTLLCYRIDMQRCELYWWDDVGVAPEERQTEPHLKGTSAVQFLLTSNITIHTLDILGAVYLNIFSCAKFDAPTVEEVALSHFGGRVAQHLVVERK